MEDFCQWTEGRAAALQGILFQKRTFSEEGWLCGRFGLNAEEELSFAVKTCGEKME